MNTFAFILVASLLMSCAKSAVDQRTGMASESINKAGLLLAEEPSISLSILEGIPYIDSLDLDLQVRWCITYGKAANVLGKNKSLPANRIERVFTKADKTLSMKERAWFNFFTANILSEQNKIDKAIELYNKALSLSEFIELNQLGGDICSALASVYRNEVKNEKAEKEYELAAQYYMRSGDVLRQVTTLGNLASMHIEKRTPSKALRYAEEADRIASTVQNVSAISISKGVLAKVYCEIGDFPLAEDCSLRAIDIDSSNAAPHYTVLAKTYMHQGKFELAKECLNKAETATSLNRSIPYIIAQCRSEIATAQGNMVDARYYKLKLTAISDSLELMAQKEQLLYAQEKLKNIEIKNESLIDELNKKEIILYLSSLIILALIGSYWFLRRYYRNRDVEAIIEKNEEHCEKLRQQDELLETVEYNAYRRVFRRNLLPPELEGEWDKLIMEEMCRYLEAQDSDDRSLLNKN